MNYVFYRNCFTGAASGGDQHLDGFIDIVSNIDNIESMLVHPKNDNQEQYYEGTKLIKNVTYTIPLFKNFAIDFCLRALAGTAVKIPKLEGLTCYVAGSHFLPDVLPVFFKSLFKKQSLSLVYIHHLVNDMNRPKNLNNFLAGIQEDICLILMRAHFDKIIVINESTRERLIEKKFKEQNIFLSDNFINNNKDYQKTYEQKNIDFIFCGRLVKQKGIFDFLRVIKDLQTIDDAITSCIVGIGPELNSINQYIKSHNLNVDIRGFVDEETKYELMSQSKYFLFPSYEEGWGIVIAEALSVGTKVVAYELPAYINLFDKYIHTVSLGDESELLMKCKELIIENFTKEYLEWQVKSIKYVGKFNKISVINNELRFVEQ